MSHVHIQMTESLSGYLRSVSLREPELWGRLRAETAALTNGNMQITPEQGQFLGMLVRLLGARRCIEIGVFTGYSAMAVASALPGDGKLIACDVSDEWTSIGRRYWVEAGLDHKIDLRLAPALETLDSLIEAGETERFDFVFIDADKQNYQAYFERALILLRRGGLVAIDNVLWHGRVLDPAAQDADTEAIRELNGKLLRDERVWLSMLPIGDGLTLAMKK